MGSITKMIRVLSGTTRRISECANGLKCPASGGCARNRGRSFSRHLFLCLGPMMLLSALGCREKPQVDYDLRVEQQSSDGTEVETPTIVAIRETIDLRVPAALPKEISGEATVQPGMPLKLELEFEGGTGFEDWPRFVMSGLYRDDTRRKPKAEQVASDGCTVDSNDEQFDEAGVRQLFEDTGTQYIQTVVDDDSSPKVPKAFFVAWAAIIGFSVIPLLLVLKMRVTNSSAPRFHVFYDMDFSPAKDAQTTTTLFADGRAMRPDVPGTVARGDVGADMDFMTGIDMEALAAIDSSRADQLVRRMMNPDPLQDQDADATAEEAGDEAATDAPPAAEPSVMDTTPWLTENPLEIDQALLDRGQTYFGIYCSVCHGMNGGGNGLVNRRAQKILASTWIPPSKLNDPTLAQEVYADGKLFNTISNGIRKMPGYASQIKARDRWAIVAYVRALQRSQNASIEEIPESQREAILAEQAEVQKQLQEAAEAEAQAASESAGPTEQAAE